MHIHLTNIDKYKDYVADHLEESLPTLQLRLYISIGAGNQHGCDVSYYGA
jgi:hypothetical protein